MGSLEALLGLLPPLGYGYQHGGEPPATVLVPYRAVITVVSVATTATRLLPNNPRRVSWTLVNLGTTRGYFAFTGNVAASAGMPVEPNGGGWVTEILDDRATAGWELWGIMPSGSANWHIIELVAE